MEEDSQQQEKTVSVNDIKTITLILVSAVPLMILKVIVLLPTSPLIIEQVTRGCVVDIEDTRKETHIHMPFIHAIIRIKQLLYID